jgi:hypothetical protein
MRSPESKDRNDTIRQHSSIIHPAAPFLTDRLPGDLPPLASILRMKAQVPFFSRGQYLFWRD